MMPRAVSVPIYWNRIDNLSHRLWLLLISYYCFVLHWYVLLPWCNWWKGESENKLSLFSRLFQRCKACRWCMSRILTFVRWTYCSAPYFFEKCVTTQNLAHTISNFKFIYGRLLVPKNRPWPRIPFVLRSTHCFTRIILHTKQTECSPSSIILASKNLTLSRLNKHGNGDRW